MTQVIASIKIFPEDIVIGIDQIKAEIVTSLPTNIQIYRFDEEPIAFGLVALIAHIIIPESEGQLERVENILKKVKGVSQIEVFMVRRI